MLEEEWRGAKSGADKTSEMGSSRGNYLGSCGGWGIRLMLGVQLTRSRCSWAGGELWETRLGPSSRTLITPVLDNCVSRTDDQGCVPFVAKPGGQASPSQASPSLSLSHPSLMRGCACKSYGDLASSLFFFFKPNEVTPQRQVRLPGKGFLLPPPPYLPCCTSPFAFVASRRGGVAWLRSGKLRRWRSSRHKHHPTLPRHGQGRHARTRGTHGRE